MANNGEVIHLDKKSDAAKKTLVGASEPEDMISPITGLRMMDFGTWAGEMTYNVGKLLWIANTS